jgi:hypothetical protein
MSKLFKSVAVLFLLLPFSGVQAAQTQCPLVASKELSSAFASSEIKLIQAHASGTCMWFVTSADTLMVNTMKRPNVKEAVTIYENYEKTTFAHLTRYVAHPKIGDKAFIGASAKGAPQTSISMLILKGDTVFTLTYNAEPSTDLKTIVAAMTRIGTIVTNNSKLADQSFGKCAWAPTAEVEKLLGNKGVTIHKLGDDQCIIYMQPGDGVITIMGDRSVDATAFSYLARANKENCKTQSLSYLNKNAYSYYDCKEPGNYTMNVEMLQNNRHMTVYYKPNNRRASVKDLEAMKPLLQHIHKSLK